MDAPNFSLQKLHTSAHRRLGMWDTFVMGSIFSGLPMLTCRPTEQDRAAEVIRQARAEHGQEKPQAVCLPHDSPTRGSQGAHAFLAQVKSHLKRASSTPGERGRVSSDANILFAKTFRYTTVHCSPE